MILQRLFLSEDPLWHIYKTLTLKSERKKYKNYSKQWMIRSLILKDPSISHSKCQFRILIILLEEVLLLVELLKLEDVKLEMMFSSLATERD